MNCATISIVSERYYLVWFPILLTDSLTEHKHEKNHMRREKCKNVTPEILACKKESNFT